MSRVSYAAQLKDPRWQKRRLEIMNRDDFTCQHCYDQESTLHVHHKHYFKGRMAWEYDDHELVTVCESCHDAMHAQSDDMKRLLARLRVDGPFGVSDAAGLIAGWASEGIGGDLGAYSEQAPYSFELGRIAALIYSRANTRNDLDFVRKEVVRMIDELLAAAKAGS